jgi:YD repeat-containing protein
MIIKEVCTYEDGSEESLEYSYDTNGNCARIVYTDAYGENFYDYTYDEHGNVVKEVFTDSDGNVQYVNTKYELLYIPCGITDGTDYFFRGLWKDRL